jgi:hypothetical protein
MKNLLRAFLLLLASLPAVSDTLPPITLRVTPKVQMAQMGRTSTIRVRITVPQNPLNRAVCVAVDGPTYRSSCFDHVGTGAAVQAEWAVSGLEPGGYVAEARLERAKEGESGRDYKFSRETFEISGGF